MKKILCLAMGVMITGGISSAAHALPINSPVPSNAYISIGGLDWAWASPCDAVGGCGDIDLSFQGTLGWHLPTPAEFLLHPSASDFLFAGGNVPDGGIDPLSGSMFGFGTDDPVFLGSDGACAATYFGTVWLHCDYNDGASGDWYNPASGGDGASETLVVRDSVGVPEPATLALFGAGLLGLAAIRRRRKAKA